MDLEDKSVLFEWVKDIKLPENEVIATLFKFNDSWIGKIVKGENMGKYYFLQTYAFDEIKFYKDNSFYMGRMYNLKEGVPSEYLEFIKSKQTKQDKVVNNIRLIK